MKEILKALADMTEMLNSEAESVTDMNIANAANVKLEKLNLLLAPYKAMLDKLPHINNCYNTIQVNINPTMRLIMSERHKKYNYHFRTNSGDDIMPVVKTEYNSDYLYVNDCCINDPIIQELDIHAIISDVKKKLLKHIDHVTLNSEKRMNKRIEALSKFDVNISIPETFDDLLELLIDTNEQFKQTDNKELISIISSIIDNIKLIRKEVN